MVYLLSASLALNVFLGYILFKLAKDFTLTEYRSGEKSKAIVQLSQALLRIYEGCNNDGIHNEEIAMLRDIINTEEKS